MQKPSIMDKMVRETGRDCMYALVTGASSGIGKAIAFALASEGYDILLVARREERLTTIAADLIGDHDIEAIPLSCDLGDPDSIAQLLKQTIPFDIRLVVNNAGFGKIGLFSDIPYEDEKTMIDVNVNALHRLTKHFAKTMDEGIILNVSSMSAFLPTPKMSVYAASKAFVLNFSQAIDHELRQSKPSVRVLSLCPGPVKTEFSDVAGGNNALPAISAEHCAKAAVKGIKKKKALIIPGFLMKLMHILIAITPRRLLLRMSGFFQNKK